MGFEFSREKTKKELCTVDILLNRFSRNYMRQDHPLQRKGGRWSKEIRDGFISTVIKNEDVDAIKVCEQVFEDSRILWLIDGQQRLTALSEFKAGMFKLGKNIEFPIVTYEEECNGKIRFCEFDLRGASYDSLPKELKENFNLFEVSIVKHLACDESTIGYHIRRYNRQTSMNTSETGVTYMDNVAKDIKKIADCNMFFKECGTYTESERNKGVLYRVVSDSIMAIYFLNDWKKQARQQGAFLNKQAKTEQFDSFDKMLNDLQNILSERNNHLFTSKNSFIYFAVFHSFLKLNQPLKRFDLFLSALSDTLKDVVVDKYNVSFSQLDSNKGTKDKTVVTNKINLLFDLLIEYMKGCDRKSEVKMEIELNNERMSQQCVCESQQKCVQKILEEECGIKNDQSDVVENIEQRMIHEYVGDFSESDIDLFKDIFLDLTLEVDNRSPLLQKNNIPAFITLIAYAYSIDEDLDEWFVDYFKRVKIYDKDVVKSYQIMKRDFDLYLENVYRFNALLDEAD